MATPSSEMTRLSLRWNDIEITLEQVADLSRLAHASLREGTDPYWAYLWPSARVLMDAIAQYALAESKTPPLAGMRVIDLGCGLGGVGILAAKLGADATLVDIRDEALALAKRNAELNGVKVHTARFDWNEPPPDLGAFDAVFGADVLYGDGMLRGVLRFVRAHLAPGGRGVIADPMRVEPAGIAGASRLLGLAVESFVAQAGQTHTGGVTLYTVTKRSR